MPISTRIKNHLEENKIPYSPLTHPSSYTACVTIPRAYWSPSFVCVGDTCGRWNVRTIVNSDLGLPKSNLRVSPTGNYVRQTNKALVNVLRAGDVFHIARTGCGDLSLRRGDPVVLVFLR